MTVIPDSVARRLTGRVPHDRIRAVDVPRHDSSLVEQLLTLPDLSSAVADAMDEIGIGTVLGTSVLSPVAPGQRLCGPAVTLRYVRATADPTVIRSARRHLAVGDRDLYGLARPGDVAVFDCSGNRDWAVLGGLSALWAAKAGLAGCVVDGAIRDSDTITEVGLPVYSTSRSPRAARHRVDAVALNDMVTIAGATVCPGDYVIADDDGICLVPFEDFPAVVASATSAQAAEDVLVEAIRTSTDIEDLVTRTKVPRVPD